MKRNFPALLTSIFIIILISGCATVEERKKHQEALADRAILKEKLTEQYCDDVWSKLEVGMSSYQVEHIIGKFDIFSSQQCNVNIKHSDMTLGFDADCKLESWTHTVCTSHTPSNAYYKKSSKLTSQQVPAGFRSNTGEWRSLYNKVTSDFDRYKYSGLEITAEEFAINGEIVPLHVEMKNTSGKGSLYLFAEENDEPFSLEYKILNTGVHVSISTRLRMQRPGNFLAIFIDAEGNIFASRKRINVAIQAVLEPVTGAGVYDVHATAKRKDNSVELKMLLKAPMGTNNYINQILIRDENVNIVKVLLSPAVSMNPYFSFRFDSQYSDLNISILSVEEDLDRSWQLIPVPIKSQ